MDLQQPISSLMTTELKVLEPSDKLLAAKELFDTYSIHHIPVIQGTTLVGILSKVDYLYYLKPISPESKEQYINDIKLKNYSIGEVMSKRIISAAPTDTLKTALEIFSENLFHAIPVVDNGRLVGIITTHDIIFRLLHPARTMS